MDVNQIFFIGHNKYGQAGIGQDEHNKKYPQPKQIVFKTFIKQVSCGHHHSVLLTIDGLLYTMGSNIHGTLGLGNSGSINYAFKPTLVKDLKDVDQVFSGSYHMCALKQGELYTWGKGIDGQLGHGNMKNLFAPTKVQTLGSDVETVSCGMNHTLVTVSKTVNNLNGFAFGNGIYGQLGCGSNRSYNYPINIKIPNIQAVSAGENHSLFLSEGQIFGCGDNSSFQIGSFQDVNKNKKYILQPVKVNFFADEEISFVDCHNFSAALTAKGKSYVWGGRSKLWPPVSLNESDIINIQVVSDKVYCLNGDNELLSFTFKTLANRIQQEKEVLLKSKNVLDFDAGEHHLLALGDIVAQADDKQEQASILSVWGGQSLRSSKESFSQRSLSQKLSGNIEPYQEPIHKKMPDYFFTRHLQSGMTEEESYKSGSQVSQQNTMCFKSVNDSSEHSFQAKTSNMNTNTYDNMSSEIEIETRQAIQINETENTQYQCDKGFVKLEKKVKENDQNILSTSLDKEVSTVLEDKKFSQNKLQKLMDEMELKTVHLKKKYPMEDKENQYRQINKTPSSYIKKEPQNFVLESGQANHLRSVSSFPKISNFEERLDVAMPLREIRMENQDKSAGKKSNEITKSKSRAKSIIYYNDKENSEEEHEVSGFFKQPNESKEKQEGPSIEAIFMQLLKKQKRQKPSHEKTPRQAAHKDNYYGEGKSQGLSKSCIESKLTEPSTSRFEKEESQHNDMPKLVPINSSKIHTPMNESKLKVSKISDNSNISGRSNFKRNADLMEITRSNRELRFELRDRDLKISHLQEDLSKKQIEIETLCKQLEYFKNLRVSCQSCGSSTMVQDPFASV